MISPWNFPLAISTGMTTAAIVTGNTVVYKPSSKAPVIGFMVYKILEEAGLPAGVLNYLSGSGGRIGDGLVSHPDVAFITFTGSKAVGLGIIELAGRILEGATGVTSVIAEMGGKNAIIVDSDADLDDAVRNVLQAAFGFQGQKCSACSRLIVLEENYEKLIDRLVSAAKTLDLGPVEDPKNFMGAVIDAGAKKRLRHIVRSAREKESFSWNMASPELWAILCHFPFSPTSDRNPHWPRKRFLALSLPLSE